MWHVSGDTKKKESLLLTNKNGLFIEQNNCNKNTTAVQWIRKFNTILVSKIHQPSLLLRIFFKFTEPLQF